MLIRSNRAENMPFRFDSEKTLQAIGILLAHSVSDNRDNYMRILKLLYMADRRSIDQTGRPITGDGFVAMKRGPVLTRTYNIIKEEDSASQVWSQYIVKKGYDILLIDNPGFGKLSKYEIELLQTICEENRDLDEWAMVEKTHGFEEWKKNAPGESSKPIPLSDVLGALGKQDELPRIQQLAAESRAIKALFGGQDGTRVAVR